MTNPDNPGAGSEKEDKKGPPEPPKNKKRKATERRPKEPMSIAALQDAATEHGVSAEQLRTALLTISDQLFAEDKHIMILTHAALAFCNLIDGESHSFLVHDLLDGINANFPPGEDGDEELKQWNLRRIIIRDTLHPRDRQIIVKLGAYVILRCLNYQGLMKRQQSVIDEALCWWDFLAEARAKLPNYKRQPPRALWKLAQENYFVQVAGGLKHVTENQNHREICLDFFGSLPPNRDFPAYKDICYCLNYRYAASHGKLVKTFISISTPAYNGHGVFEYRHIHLHKDPDVETLRKARGALLKVLDNYYFLGGSAREHHVGGFPDRAEGIQAISVEARQCGHRTAGLIALFLTNDNDMRPMIGRSALIRLGSRRKIGRQDHAKFNLGVFDPNDLEDVVRADLSCLKRDAGADATEEKRAAPDEDEKAGFVHDEREAVRFIRNIINLEHLNLNGLGQQQLGDLLKRPVRADIARSNNPPVPPESKGQTSGLSPRRQD